MSNEQNKTIVRRFWKAFEANDLETLNEVLSPDLVARTPSSPNVLNREKLTQAVAKLDAAFSDRQFTIEDMVADGDQVATRVSMRGVHTGKWQGYAPSGKQFFAMVLSIERVKDGKIIDRWFSFDEEWVLRELGLEYVVPVHV